MGVGYDTVQMALLGQLTLTSLLLIAAAKGLTFIVSAAVGLPAGSVGPAVVMGAVAGAVLASLAALLLPDSHSGVALYATAGIAAMLAALINAPLAGLLAVVELTGNHQLLMPAMVTVATATLTARFSSGLPGIFAIGLAGNNYASARFRALSRVSVLATMERNIAVLAAPQLSKTATEILLLHHPRYLLLPLDNSTTLVTAAGGLAALKPDTGLAWSELAGDPNRAVAIDPTATLSDALEQMDRAATDWVFVAQSSPNNAVPSIVGVLSRAMIAQHY